MKTLSLVVPAYNEEDGIAQIIARILPVEDALEKLGLELELIVVDDGSDDQTARIASAYSDLRLIRHSRNRGYGAALKDGFRHATGEYLAFIDADGTYPPESLPDLCRSALEFQADMVIGSRMNGTNHGMPFTRKLGNLAYSILLRTLSQAHLRDTTSGMRLLRKAVLPRLYPLPDGLDFTPAMSTRAVHENLKIIEVPIPYAERIGRSKLSVVRDGFRFTNAIVWTALTYNPVRILGMIGVAALGVAVTIAAWLVAMRMRGVTDLDPIGVFAVFATLMTGMFGVSVFSLGAMFNYLVALFQKQSVRRGLFGTPIFNPSLDHHFGWMGLLCALAGLALGLVSFALGVNGWLITRLWFYLLLSASLILIGVQLTIAWIIMRVLEQLAQRELATSHDLAPVHSEPSRSREREMRND